MTVENDNQPTRLLILGNGADLHSGLRSSFLDFIKMTYSTSAIKKRPLIAINRENKGFVDKLYEKNRNLHVTQLELAGLIRSRLKTKNIWASTLLFSKTFNSLKERNWADIESNIQEILENKNMQEALRDGMPPQFKVPEDKVPEDKDIRFIYMCSLLIESHHDKDIKDFLLSQLLDLENQFKAYIQTQVENKPNYAKKITRLISTLVPINGYNVLNFNYTNLSSALHLANSNFFPTVCKNVHGTIYNHPIIGIDSTNIAFDAPEVPFTKTFRTLSFQGLPGNGKKSTILNSNIREIVFYGHSLSLNDFAYFESIFDFYNIYNSKVRLVFAYSTYSQKLKSEIKNNIYIAITELLNRYGEKMEDQNHGKNLMHKLMLEERLFLQEV